MLMQNKGSFENINRPFVVIVILILIIIWDFNILFTNNVLLDLCFDYISYFDATFNIWWRHAALKDMTWHTFNFLWFGLRSAKQPDEVGSLPCDQKSLSTFNHINRENVKNLDPWAFSQPRIEGWEIWCHSSILSFKEGCFLLTTLKDSHRTKANEKNAPWSVNMHSSQPPSKGNAQGLKAFHMSKQSLMICFIKT